MNTAPFPLGTTWYGTDQAIDVTSTYANVGGQHLEGQQCEVRDINPTTPLNSRSANLIKTRIVRNVSGVTLVGKYAATYINGTKLKRVGGYHRSDLESIAGVIDPYLTSNGVRDGDLFHLVEEGYCIIKTPKTGAGFNLTTWAAGDDLCALTDTAANGTTTTAANIAGRLQGVTTGTWTATQTTDGTMANYKANIVAEVVSAMTSSQTSADCLIRLKLPR